VRTVTHWTEQRHVLLCGKVWSATLDATRRPQEVDCKACLRKMLKQVEIVIDDQITSLALAMETRADLYKRVHPWKGPA
jgi:hypothetical protein